MGSVFEKGRWLHHSQMLVVYLIPMGSAFEKDDGSIGAKYW